MHVEKGLSPVLTLKSACVGKMCNFKKNVWVKGSRSILADILFLYYVYVFFQGFHLTTAMNKL